MCLFFGSCETDASHRCFGDSPTSLNLSLWFLVWSSSHYRPSLCSGEPCHFWPDPQHTAQWKCGFRHSYLYLVSASTHLKSNVLKWSWMLRAFWTFLGCLEQSVVLNSRGVVHYITVSKVITCTGISSLIMSWKNPGKNIQEWKPRGGERKWREEVT